jgi:Fic family protein
MLCSIEEYLGRNTPAYYAVLADVGKGSWQPENDARPWIRFSLTAHYRQAMTLNRRLKHWSRVWEEVERHVLHRNLPERSMQELVNAAMGYRVRNSTYRLAAEVSDNVATRDLKVLVDQRLLISKGERRGRWYEAAPLLTSIRERFRESGPIEDPFTAIGQLRQS